MDHPTDKSALLERIQSAHSELEQALDGLSDEAMDQPGAQDDWSVKDLLAHITFWEERLLAHLAHRLRGEAVPADNLPNEDDRTWLDRVNEENYQRNHRLPLAQVRAAFEQTYDRLLQEIEAIPADDLRRGKVESLFGDSLHEVFGPDTYDHYPEHTESIRNWRATREGARA